jgi:hypothetical protein
MGHQRAVLFRGGEREIYHHNDTIPGLPPPHRELGA